MIWFFVPCLIYCWSVPSPAAEAGAVLSPSKIESEVARQPHVPIILNTQVPDPVMNAMRHTAKRLWNDGKMSEAVAAYRELIRQDDLTKPPSPFTGVDLFALGSILVELNRLDDATGCFNRALSVFKDRPIDAAEVKLSLGGLQVIRGLFAEAQESLLSARETFTKYIGLNDIRTARAWNVSGWLYTIWGRMNEAEEASSQADAIADRVLAPDSIERVRFLDYRAEYLAAIGHYADAEKLWQRATSMIDKVVGESSSQFDSVYLHLAQVYSLTGDTREAQAMLKRFLAIEQKLVPAGSLAQAVGLAELGNTYTHLHQYADAESTLNRSMDMMARLPSGVPLTNAFIGTYLGDFYVTQRRWSDAETLYRQALQLRQAAAPTSTLVAASLYDLAYVLDKLRRKDEAKKYKDQAQAILGGHFNPAYTGNTVDVKSFRGK